MNQTENISKKIKRDAAAHQFPIAGIGASAGGLEALEGLFSHMPSDSNSAFIVIQHLDPKHKSIMGSLLAKHTQMKILQIKDGMKIEKNCIYLNPPNRHVGILNRRLFLIEPGKLGHIRLPIDYFFRSLSEDLGEGSICIILSGTGTDGTLGLKAVKGVGGMAMVQEPAQAAYPGMPGSAIETGLVDFICAVEKMGAKLLNYLRHPYVSEPEEAPANKDSFAVFIQKILFLIRRKTGNDFSKYKQNTICRRIERRMALHQIEKINDYFIYLQQNPAEVDTLHKDLLIGVTNFFRDSEAFTMISGKVLPEILTKKAPDESVRIWVPGCATGEEAYSLAMLAVEGMEKVGKHFNIQVFATDIDIEAIETARTAVYPDNIVADVSAQRLDRFFNQDGKTFRIKKQIRDMLVFAVQNLIKDPPFSKLDLVSCRNLLIYMGADLQKKILPLFHYTLNPQGFLFLGSSETIGGFVDLFSAVDNKWKIFRPKDSGSNLRNGFSIPPFQESRAEDAHPVAAKVASPVSLKEIAEKILLEDYAPAGVLINEKFDILYFMGETDRYLMQPTGEPSRNILKLARKELHYKLNKALASAVRQKKTSMAQGIGLKDGHNFKTLDITVRPIANPAALQNLMLVVFEERTSAAPAAAASTAASKKKTARTGSELRITQLEDELRFSRETLQITIEQLETSNEELKSINEELQSTNEELQSTNEELETSKEEMHSTNEELVTVNSELQIKVNELEEVNNDISNLLASTDIATLFLDNHLHIRRFTPAATNLFNLIASDIGRPLGDITTQIYDDTLQADCKKVLDSLVPQETQIQTRNGEWLTMRLRPYRTLENLIDGVVITFKDITREKTAQHKAIKARILAENIVNTVREPLVVLDQKFRVMSANQSFYRTFEVNEAETEQKIFFELGDCQWDIPRLKKQIHEILPQKKSFKNFKVDHNFPRIGRRVMLLNGRQVVDQADGGSSLILLAIEDITDLKGA
jgi:two-component system CheB/CheR fusion protein